MDKGSTAKLGVLLSLVAVLSGCAGVPQSGATWSAEGWDWMMLGGIALAAMASLLALSYMAAVFMNDEQMLAWTKREVGQLAYSAFIFACVIALSASADGWLKLLSLASPSPVWQDYVNAVVCCNPLTQSCVVSPALAGNRPCHIALAQDYLQILFESGRTMADGILGNYYVPAMLSQISISISSPVMLDLLSFNFKPFPARTIDMQFYGVLFDLTFKTMVFIRVQQIFLDFMWGAIVPVMLGIGLALRAFHFSRKMGGMLIALGMSIYIVMPMFYVLLSGILFGFVPDWGHPQFGVSFDPNSLPVQPPMNISTAPMKQSEILGTGQTFMNLCGTAKPEELEEQGGLVDFLWNIIKILWNSTLNVVGNIVAPAGQLGDDPETAARFAADGPVSSLAMLMVFTVITPFLGLMTMLASFKYFSPLIGGDVELSLLSRLI
ncbi:MAG: hypothetical protein WCT52_00115 [Candidatus Micrarchaeia archaeon]